MCVPIRDIKIYLPNSLSAFFLTNYYVMKYFQLFTDRPNIDFMTSLVNCYGLESMDDSKEFCKEDLVELDTIKKIEELDKRGQRATFPSRSFVH